MEIKSDTKFLSSDVFSLDSLASEWSVLFPFRSKLLPKYFDLDLRNSSNLPFSFELSSNRSKDLFWVTVVWFWFRNCSEVPNLISFWKTFCFRFCPSLKPIPPKFERRIISLGLTRTERKNFMEYKFVMWFQTRLIYDVINAVNSNWSGIIDYLPLARWWFSWFSWLRK